MAYVAYAPLFNNALFYLHVRIVWAATAFGYHPGNVLTGVLYVAGFAVDTVLRVNLKSWNIILHDDLVHTHRAVSLCRLSEARQVHLDRNIGAF